jgi:CRP-like cAMP-binding protein
MQIKPLHHQLENLQCLDAADFTALDSLLTQEEKILSGKLLISEGGKLSRVLLLSKGWAIRYKSIPDGRRQILNFLLPGDIVGFFSLLFKTAEYGVETLTQVTVNSFKPAQLLEAFKKAPRLAVSLSWLAGQDERQLDEQIMRIGRRNAVERMAHLFMELHYRLFQAGITDEDARRFPLTQNILADTLGMSHVHANRSFMTLARKGFVILRDGEILLLKPADLAEIANFDGSYLEQQPLPATTKRELPEKC